MRFKAFIMIVNGTSAIWIGTIKPRRIRMNSLVGPSKRNVRQGECCHRLDNNSERHFDRRYDYAIPEIILNACIPGITKI